MKKTDDKRKILSIYKPLYIIMSAIKGKSNDIRNHGKDRPT